ncbi:hypothetical protein IF2G_00018 [Cordyceps javanica]|nr:hypothetical protein IF2G_00018 [Cordyceps javanica]
MTLTLRDGLHDFIDLPQGTERFTLIHLSGYQEDASIQPRTFKDRNYSIESAARYVSDAHMPQTRLTRIEVRYCVESDGCTARLIRLTQASSTRQTLAGHCGDLLVYFPPNNSGQPVIHCGRRRHNLPGLATSVPQKSIALRNPKHDDSLSQISGHQSVCVSLHADAEQYNAATTVSSSGTGTKTEGEAVESRPARLIASRANWTSQPQQYRSLRA